MCGQQLQLELLTSTLLCDSGEIRNDSCGFPYGCCYCDQDLQCYFSSNLKCYRLLLLYSSGNLVVHSFLVENHGLGFGNAHSHSCHFTLSSKLHQCKLNHC